MANTLASKSDAIGATPRQNRGSHRFCVAPMMDCTDRHYRYLARLLSRHARLYTEMVTAVAVVRNHNPARFLDFDPAERPLALQLGGSDPEQMARAAVMAAQWGYDEVNINVGCPSDKVTSGRFGACLMAEPDLVADCVKAMRDAAPLPVTVKTRIGIDDRDADHHLDGFVAAVAASGCDTFVIHARKAILRGLSPKENREIPPLDYGRVRRLKDRFPGLTVILNGGLKTLAECAAHLAAGGGTALDGVMVGRAAYESPALLSDVDRLFFGEPRPARPTADIVADYLVYAGCQIAAGERPHHVLRHLVGLYRGCAGARAWRQTVSRACQTEASLLEITRLAERMERHETLAA